MNKNLSLLVLSQVFGFTANIITVFLSGIIGSMISSTAEGMSTGPVIVITITAILGISFVFSPKQGYLFKHLRNQRKSQNSLDNIKTIADKEKENHGNI